ncbi:amidase [Gracilibacillus caseinilyticus]|uniref:Amidase n=1 Tax=Gracilibacillus caseinilyticus TaxID=2932256 RepID=A0ABY4EYA2_9BACI|nr:amidase [Gracilibacillus caseinilyticus]UOQ49243.1 amidase [Gracilibacillus caseinilyticus]
MDQWRAFVEVTCNVPPKQLKGSLFPYTFAVKDVFDIRGYLNTAGNPDWERTHTPAKSTAPAIEALLENGASLIGKTHTDELMYSLNGENYHYGTPVNPRATNRIPGGSSSGSAVAVAAGLVDFSIGTDTGGSVRIPSSYCGIIGYRPTHQAIDIRGVIPLADSFDTVGIMANDIKVLEKVSNVLLDQPVPSEHGFTTLKFPTDIWEMAVDPVKDQKQNIPLLDCRGEEIEIAGTELEKWKETFRILQGYEIWQNHGAWIESASPTFGPGIMERFQWTKTITASEVEMAKKEQVIIQARMKEILADGSLLVMPTSPNIAPRLNMEENKLNLHRQKLLTMTSIAGLNQLPQISLPWMEVEGNPIGLSIIAGKNQDTRLIEFIRIFYQMLKQ